MKSILRFVIPHILYEQMTKKLKYTTKKQNQKSTIYVLSIAMQLLLLLLLLLSVFVLIMEKEIVMNKLWCLLINALCFTYSSLLCHRIII